MSDLITNHIFIRGRDGRCGYTYGSGAERERCGNKQDRHAPGVLTRDQQRALADNPAFIPLWLDPVFPSTEDQQMEDPLTNHEATKRVLFHLVNTYQSWRDKNSGIGVPNEFTDDAVRIGEQHLRDVDWFPEDDADTPPTGGSKIPTDEVLDLIDAELERLREPLNGRDSFYFGRRKRGWVGGVSTARQVSASKLQTIRDAYVTASIVRETESLRLYDIQKSDIDA